MKHCNWIGILCVLSIVAPQVSRADGPAAQPTTAPANTAAPQIGVVDLDRVAVEMGWSKEMKENLTLAQASLRSDLNRAQAVQEGMLRQKKIDLGLKETDTEEEMARKLTPPQQREFFETLNTARQQMSQLQQAANQEFQAYQAGWMKQYRDGVGPMVRRMAQERKLLVVLSLPGNVLFSEPSIDLSDAIVKELKANPLVINPVPLPHLGGATQPTSQPATAPKGG